jgi:hypothetical protein
MSERKSRRTRSFAGADSLDRMLAQVAREAAKSIPEVTDALDAEQWASSLMATWLHPSLPDHGADALLFPRLVRALEALATAPALAALRALSAVGSEEQASSARAAADRLAAARLPEPPWAGGLGRVRPAGAALLDEPAFDDGVSVVIEFAGPGPGSHTLGVSIDHNLGGLVKDAFLAGSLAEVRAELARHAPAGPGVSIRELGLDEARARVEAALTALDHALDPPVGEDVRALRALVDARMRLLPAGFELPAAARAMTPYEREALVADFLASADGEGWRGDAAAEEVTRLAIDFGADYNHGGPLRWSPAVVEAFMTDWLARKIPGVPAFFERVPEVLTGWVRYAGRRRGLPAPMLREAVAAVEEHRGEMLEAVVDPRAWGPAKALAVAALEAGIDLTDPDAIERFIRRYNEGLAA